MNKNINNLTDFFWLEVEGINNFYNENHQIIQNNRQIIENNRQYILETYAKVN